MPNIKTSYATAFHKNNKIDFGVIEVGMGGRFDATNVIKPHVSLITSISYDHMKVLGNTLKKIAFEKAGIIKENIPVVVAKQKYSPLHEIRRIAHERNVRMIYAPDLFKVEIGSYSLDGQNFKLLKNNELIADISIPLLGDHQINNAVTAYACIEELRSQGIIIGTDAVTKGYKNMRWPGRFEVINRKPLIIIDGAHNLDSFKKLTETIHKYLPEKRIILIFGASEDKAAESMLGIIKPVIHTLIITRSEHPRAMDLRKIESVAKSLNLPYVIEENIKNAIGEALVLCDEMTAIIAAGSIFIAGAVRENFKG